MITNGHAHVWVLDIAVDGGWAVDAHVLSQDEQTVASRFLRHDDRVRYVCAHVALRRVLAAYTGYHPSRLQFATTPEGKPYLPGSHIHFNLSHSGRCVAIAVCAGGPVGVDVEEIRIHPEWRDLARVYFAPRELAWLSAGSEDRQLARFYRLWTMKEALVKATGAGVSALATAAITDEWHVEEFDRLPDYAAAVVVARGVNVQWRTRSEGTQPWQSSPTS